MSQLQNLYARMIEAMDVPGLSIPAICVKLYHKSVSIPDTITPYSTMDETVLCCQAVRHAIAGEPVLITLENIGCVAAAISLGLVDQHRTTPIPPPIRRYVNVMREQSGMGENFSPPSPEEFTSGIVYACKNAGRQEFGLFGPEDSGRFQSVSVAQKAIAGMAAIQPPVIKGVFIYPIDFGENAPEPDIVILVVRPVELARLIQGYQFLTGQSISAVMNPLRAVDSDLIARPYLTGEINVTAFCLGARLMARFAGDRMGMGMPFSAFRTLVDGMEQSRTGYPFHRYPGADGHSC